MMRDCENPQIARDSMVDGRAQVEPPMMCFLNIQIIPKRPHSKHQKHGWKVYGIGPLMNKKMKYMECLLNVAHSENWKISKIEKYKQLQFHHSRKKILIPGIIAEDRKNTCEHLIFPL